MADTISAEARSRNMSRIRSFQTKPELKVYSLLKAQGLKILSNVRDLPGKPDLVLPMLRTCVFVHGCFWHGCTRCIDGKREVKSNMRYWGCKVARNRQRDERNTRRLRNLGWHVFTVWECQIAKEAAMRRLVNRLLALSTEGVRHNNLGRRCEQ